MLSRMLFRMVSFLPMRRSGFPACFFGVFRFDAFFSNFIGPFIFLAFLVTDLRVGKRRSDFLCVLPFLDWLFMKMIIH